jgi:hypothetical protein
LDYLVHQEVATIISLQVRGTGRVRDREIAHAARWERLTTDTSRPTSGSADSAFINFDHTQSSHAVITYPGRGVEWSVTIKHSTMWSPRSPTEAEESRAPGLERADIRFFIVRVPMSPGPRSAGRCSFIL